jgi:hypothetical protein
MRSRVFALLLAVVFGLAGNWPSLAGHAPVRVVAAAAAVQDASARADRQHAAGPAHASESAPAQEEHDPVVPAEPLAETWIQSLAEGAPDLPALFPASPAAHPPTATMAPPRPHGAASWRRLYPSVPLRPPRTLPATA